MTPRAATVVLYGMLAACGSDQGSGDDDGHPLGPGGTYAMDMHCTPYSSGNGPS